MSAEQGRRKDRIIAVGLGLPALLIAGVAFVRGFSGTHPVPPRYGMLFSQDGNGTPTGDLHVSEHLNVKDGVLVAEYVRPGFDPYLRRRQLFLFDAATGEVKELERGPFPQLEGTEARAEVVVDSTRSMLLDANLRAPDGYVLSFCDPREPRSRWLPDLFPGHGNKALWPPCFTDGQSNFPLTPDNTMTQFLAGNMNFIGWVVGHAEEKN